jgi:exosortase
LGVLAYRALLRGVMASDYELESWLFRPSQLPPLLVLTVAGWLLWRRRDRLCSLPDRRAPLLAATLAALGVALFGWALLTRTADLLLPSASANLLAFAAVFRGWAGCRSLLLPALLLLFGARIPTPLQNEIVWHLQLWTASAAGQLLDAIGREVIQGGVILSDEEHTFHVIEGCSGLNGIEILTLVGLMIRELFADGGRRQWLLVALAPCLGFALNLVRIAYVAASPNPEALAGVEGDHTPQGLAVLVAGTGILYAFGWAMARNHRAGSAASGSDAGEPALRGAPWGLAAVGLGLLAALTLVLPRFEPAERARHHARTDFPERKSAWTSAAAPGDPLFLGPLQGAIQRRYELDGARQAAPQVVDVLIGFDVADLATPSPLLSSKLAYPGPDWDIVRKGRERLWSLDRVADLAIATRGPGSEHAVVYAWRPRDEGLWRESWRSLLALESSPLRREGRRAAVRLVAYAPHDGQLVLDQAKQRLDRFIVAFREELAAF